MSTVRRTDSQVSGAIIASAPGTNLPLNNVVAPPASRTRRRVKSLSTFVFLCYSWGRKGLKRKVSKSPGSGRNAPADLLCEAHSTRDAYCSGRLILPSHTSLAALQILTTNSHHVREITGTHATADRKLDILQQPPSPPLLLEPVDRDLGFPRPVAPQQQPEQTIICPITMRRVSRGGRVCIFIFLLPVPTRDRIGVHSRTQ